MRATIIQMLGNRTWCTYHLGKVGLKALSIMSPSNISSAGGPRFVRTAVALAFTLLQIAHELNYPIPVLGLVIFAPGKAS